MLRHFYPFLCLLSITVGSTSLAVERSELSRQILTSVEEFESMGIINSDLGLSGVAVKFLIDARTADASQVYFINANYQTDNRTPDAALFHYDFAKAALQIPEDNPTFNAITYFTNPKRYVAGTLRRYNEAASGQPLYALQFYPQDIIQEEHILAAVTLVAKALQIPGITLGFVATGSQQTTATISDALQRNNILNLSINDVLGAVNYIPMNLGEAYGILRVFPGDADQLTLRDIPVFDELPLDLTVVAGVITKAYQDTNSHINLKSKERKTPNMVLRNASWDHEILSRLNNQIVHLKVDRDRFVLEPATQEELDFHIKNHFDKPWIPMHTVDQREVLSFDEICPLSPGVCLEKNRSYGSKAVNLGFLAHPKVAGRKNDTGSISAELGYDLTPYGVAVPFTFYTDLVNDPDNADLKAALALLITREKAGDLNVTDRLAMVTDVQEKFLNAKISKDAVKTVRKKIKTVAPGVRKFKVRSSANAEDIEGFDGAGLYNSYGVDLEEKDDDSKCRVVEKSASVFKVKPDTLACGIKAVYASLWNKRAIEERSFARLDHATAVMGLAIVPKYDTEQEIIANSVIVTRVINSDTVYGYTISTQKDNNLVTNPDPGTWSELTIAAFLVGENQETSLSITRYAKPTPDSPVLADSVLPAELSRKMVEVTAKIETAYCLAKRSYYGGNCRYVVSDITKPRSLDLEFKILENGQLVAKQVREFSGR